MSTNELKLPEWPVFSAHIFPPDSASKGSPTTSHMGCCLHPSQYPLGALLDRGHTAELGV